MKREIAHSLVDWKDRKTRKPLLIRGARQVGKTYEIEHFAREHFTNLIKINLEFQKEFCSIFSNHYFLI